MHDRTFVFDLDGTLVDSLPDLRAALNRQLTPRGLAPLALADIAPLVGDGARRLVDRAFAARGRVADTADFTAFLADYTAHADQETRPYPGVIDTLRRLAEAGWRLAICTNKPLAATETLVAALGLTPWFAAIGAGDSFATQKPDPAHLLATIAAAGGEPGRSIMAGDHANDVAAARGAGVPCIFAAWGYGPPAMAAGATLTADSFRELPALGRRLLPARDTEGGA